MSAIRHCGQARKTVVYWLVPRDGERKQYKHLRLFVAQCPACNAFIMEWAGINLENRHCIQHRIAQRDHDSWIERTKTDLDDEMDSARAPKKIEYKKRKGISPIESLRVHSSMQQFPWNHRMVPIR